MGAGDSYSFYAYASDDGTAYAIKLSAVVAAQGGFNTVVDPRGVKVWPFHSRNLRHVWGVTSTTPVKRTRLPIATNNQALYTTGGQFTLAAGTYNVEGAIGEKRKFNSVA